MNKINVDKRITYSFWVVVSAIIQAFAMSSFSVPGKMIPGGVTGLSRIVSDILSENYGLEIPYTIFLVVINLGLGFFVYKYVGKIFTLLSLAQIILMSIFTTFMKPVMNIDDLLLLAVFGGILNGFAVGLSLTHNASTGGLDFISIYLANKYKKSMWNVQFGFNCFIIIATGVLYGWERALYTIIFQYCTTQVMNRMHKRYTSQTITIITTHPDEVSNQIFNTIRHGITEIKAVGAYKHTDTTMLYTVVNGYQTDDVVKAILSVDDKAFINIQDTKLVIGNYYQKPLD